MERPGSTDLCPRHHECLFQSALLPQHRDAEQQEAGHENRGRENVDLRREGGATRAVHVQRVGDLTPRVEQRDDEVVERQRERQHPRGDDAGGDERQRHLHHHPEWRKACTYRLLMGCH